MCIVFILMWGVICTFCICAQHDIQDQNILTPNKEKGWRWGRRKKRQKEARKRMFANAYFLDLFHCLIHSYVSLSNCI